MNFVSVAELELCLTQNPKIYHKNSTPKIKRTDHIRPVIQISRSSYKFKTIEFNPFIDPSEDQQAWFSWWFTTTNGAAIIYQTKLPDAKKARRLSDYQTHSHRDWTIATAMAGSNMFSEDEIAGVITWYRFYTQRAFKKLIRYFDQPVPIKINDSKDEMYPINTARKAMDAYNAVRIRDNIKNALTAISKPNNASLDEIVNLINKQYNGTFGKTQIAKVLRKNGYKKVRNQYITKRGLRKIASKHLVKRETRVQKIQEYHKAVRQFNAMLQRNGKHSILTTRSLMELWRNCSGGGRHFYKVIKELKVRGVLRQLKDTKVICYQVITDAVKAITSTNAPPPAQSTHTVNINKNKAPPSK